MEKRRKEKKRKEERKMCVPAVYYGD
jgi:hypothetical protein